MNATIWAGEEATRGEKYTCVLYMYIQMKPYNSAQVAQPLLSSREIPQPCSLAPIPVWNEPFSILFSMLCNAYAITNNILLCSCGSILHLFSSHHTGIFKEKDLGFFSEISLAGSPYKMDPTALPQRQNFWSLTIIALLLHFYAPSDASDVHLSSRPNWMCSSWTTRAWMGSPKTFLASLVALSIQDCLIHYIAKI